MGTLEEKKVEIFVSRQENHTLWGQRLLIQVSTHKAQETCWYDKERGHSPVSVDFSNIGKSNSGSGHIPSGRND